MQSGTVAILCAGMGMLKGEVVVLTGGQKQVAILCAGMGMLKGVLPLPATMAISAVAILCAGMGISKGLPRRKRYQLQLGWVS